MHTVLLYDILMQMRISLGLYQQVADAIGAPSFCTYVILINMSANGLLYRIASHISLNNVIEWCLVTEYVLTIANTPFYKMLLQLLSLILNIWVNFYHLHRLHHSGIMGACRAFWNMHPNWTHHKKYFNRFHEPKLRTTGFTEIVMKYPGWMMEPPRTSSWAGEWLKHCATQLPYTVNCT